MSHADSADLEREAEAVRAQLSDTADELRARMSPGQLMDEMLNQVRGGDGSQMLANLRTQARDNPMALALIGGGVAWLMLGSGPSAPDNAPRFTPPPAEGLDPTAPLVAGHPGHGLRTPDHDRPDHDKPADEGGSAGVGEAVMAARDAAGDRLHQAGDHLARTADSLRSAGTSAVGDARTAAADLGHQARRTFLDALEREPLVIGALGVAVGAAIGALLPSTEIERQHLGSAGEALKEKADALVDRGTDAVKAAAGEVYETARDEADRQGLVPGDAPISEKIDAVARAVGEKATEISQRQASGTPAKVD